VPVFPVHYLTEDGVCSCGGPEVNPRCKPAKHPITLSGHKSAMTDADVVGAWWTKDPGANIGMPTGPRTGVLVLDGDGEEGVGTLEERGYPQDAPRVRTGSGGLHVYVAYPRDAGEDIRNSVKSAPGLDVRGKGGYVLLPPSRNVNGPYGWELEWQGKRVDLPEPPRWFLDLIREGGGEGTPKERFDTARVLAGVPEGERDEVLFKLACKLLGADVPQDVAERLVCEAASNCDPPFEEEKALEKVRRAYRTYEPGSSGTASGGKPTHDELARRFLEGHPGYGYGQAEWKRYESGVWRPVPDAVAERQIFDVLVAAKDEKVQPTANLLASVTKLARVLVAVPDEEWDSDPDVLVCQNGTLHVPSGELGPHDRTHHATSGVPYDYDPEATARTWGRFLGDFVDAETAHFLQEFSGYALTSDVSHEVALWLFGAPGGGRSTFIAGLEAMLGERSGTLGLGEVERSRFALADVPGKTLLTATEQPAGYMKASYVLNALISGDKLKVEEKFKPAYDVYPKAKILWAMNELPRVPSANDGLFRRVKVVEIEPIPEGERDPEIKEKVKEEGAGILNWALEGLARLRRRGGFEVPSSVKGATARWRETNDVPAMFVAEECKLNGEKSERSSDLYRRYRFWCEDNGHKPKSSTQIAEDWRRLGFERKRDKQGILWCGVELRKQYAGTIL
jgi:putative DNA primase/helicase